MAVRPPPGRSGKRIVKVRPLHRVATVPYPLLKSLALRFALIRTLFASRSAKLSGASCALDGKWLAYSQVDDMPSDIMLVEHFEWTCFIPRLPDG